MAGGLTTKDYNGLFLTLLQALRRAPDEDLGDRLVELLAAQPAESRRWPRDDEFRRSLTRPGV